MISLARWFRFRSGEREAKAAVENSKAEQVSAHRLNAEVQNLHQGEDRITARVHEAFRGGQA